MLGKPIYFLDKYDLWRFPDSMKTPLGWIGYRYDPSFVSFVKVQIETTEKKIKIRQTDPVTINAITKMPQAYYNFIAGNSGLPSKIMISVFNKFGWIKDYDTPLTIQQVAQGRFQFTFYPQLEKGNYYLLFTTKRCLCFMLSQCYFYPFFHCL